MTFAPEPEDAGVPEPRVEIVRSRKRRRTVSARRDGDRIVVLVPAGLPRAQEQSLVDEMVARLARREARTQTGDVELTRRAAVLSERFLEGRARPSSVRWVTNQNTRWGSCTPAEGTIRLSHKLRQMPTWVVDYVLVHELAHLLVAGHGPRFWQLVEAYPRTERARGFLEGVALTAGLDLSPDADGDDPAEQPDQLQSRLAADGGPAA
jgi:predicted metal-dependent hydrolase